MVMGGDEEPSLQSSSSPGCGWGRARATPKDYRDEYLGWTHLGGSKAGGTPPR